jgi:hypothetical protein
LGIADVIKFILFRIFKEEKTQISNSDEAEFVIRSLATRYSWNPKYNSSQLICLDSSGEKETQKIFEIASGEFDFIKFKKTNS